MLLVFSHYLMFKNFMSCLRIPTHKNYAFIHSVQTYTYRTNRTGSSRPNWSRLQTPSSKKVLSVIILHEIVIIYFQEPVTKHFCYISIIIINFHNLWFKRLFLSFWLDKKLNKKCSIVWVKMSYPYEKSISTHLEHHNILFED